MPHVPSARMIHRGYTAEDTARGNGGHEIWEVKGVPVIGVHISPQAQALGLPKRGDTQAGNGLNICYSTSVMDIRCSEIGWEVALVSVRYKPINWDISRYLGGATFGSDPLEYYVPIIKTYTASVGPSLQILERRKFWRNTSLRTFTVRGGATLNEAQVARDNNIGKWYLFDGIYYLLDNVVARADRGNNVVIDTYFRTNAVIREFPLDFFGGNSFLVPRLPALAEYDIAQRPNGDFFPIGYKGVIDLYEEGDDLPWL